MDVRILIAQLKEVLTKKRSLFSFGFKFAKSTTKSIDMKKVFLFFLLSTVVYASNAQRESRSRTALSSTSHFGIGVEAGLPLGDNGKPYSAVLGGNLQYETMPDTDLGITVSAGYSHWPLKSSYGSGSVGFVPLLGGVKYYFTPAAFFHAQLGAAFGTKTGMGTSFAYSPGVGLKLSPNIDATLKYTGFSKKGETLENVGLRFGFNF
ncbi:MAG: hypothetical protein JWR87_2519 [Segetibacter sp.]|nr:hypothetical protein [Segetibacter sp.]